jgi:hypothetical protein
MPPNMAWVDYPDVNRSQGEIDSANLLANVVGTDVLPDLAIGRIPVNSAAQFDAVIDKIIAAETTTRQPWQQHLLFVADNVPDPAGDFQTLSNNLIRDFLHPPYQGDKAYLSGTAAQEQAAIVNGVNSGALMVSYIGHGSINYWAAEKILTIPLVNTLTNSDRFPVVLSMTCSDGYWIAPYSSSYPYPSSLAEELLRASGKGALATFSPTGYGTTYAHDILERAWMKAYFQQRETRVGKLADAARLSLFASGSSLELINQFIVFGDPATRLPSPLENTYIPGVHH